MQILETIEQQFHFTYPQLYKKLYADGQLNWGHLNPDWFQNVYPTLKDKPPFLLYAKDFELLDFEQIIEELESLNAADDYRKVNPIFKFIPFAMNGAGDLYCFYYSLEFPESIPLVLATHDSLQLHILTKNLEDFILAQMLEAVTDISSEDLIMDGDFKENARNFLNTHHTYLNEKRQNILKEIYQRDLCTTSYQMDLTNGKSYTKVETGLLTTDELTEILRSEISFEQRFNAFDYTFPEVVPEITENNKRRLGTLMIRLNPILQKQHQLIEVLKKLNWRKRTTDLPDIVEYYRNGSVIFGIPSMETVEETFKDQLLYLKNTYPSIEIYFYENEPQIQHQL